MRIHATNILTRMHHAPLPAALCLITFGLVRPVTAQDAGGESTPAADSAAVWTEDFADASWVERWVPFGRLADGTWAQGVEGHWPQGEKTVFARREWWQLEDGAIRGTNFPDEKHAAGLSRRAKFPRDIQETLQQGGVRVRSRLRLGPDATARIKIGGASPGLKPDEATDNHVAAVDVRPAGIRFWNGNRTLVAEAVAATAGAPAAPRKFQNTVLEEVSETPVAPLEWHECVYELRNRDVRVVVDGKEAVTYRLPHDQPIQSLSLEVDGDKKSPGQAWFDRIAVEPLAP
jgi:hypothetical protein